MSNPKPGWQAHEAFVNEVLGLDAPPASGAHFHAPGDGVDNTHPDETYFPLIVDCKCTERDSYSIKAKTLQQWHTKAMELGKRFAMPIRFWKPGAPVHADYILLHLNDFAELLEKAREHSWSTQGASR